MAQISLAAEPADSSILAASSSASPNRNKSNGKNSAKKEEHRIKAACTGAIVTSLTMTPFDVVKMRMQTQTPESMFLPSSHVPPPSLGSAGPSSSAIAAASVKGKGRALNQHTTSVSSMQHARSLAATNLATCCQKTYFTTNLADKKDILCAFDPREARAPAASVTASSVASTSSRPFSAVIRNIPIAFAPPNYSTAALAIDSSGACLYPSPALAAEHLPHLSAPSSRHFNGFFDALISIPKHEGITALWRGVSASLVMSVPAQVMYMVGYDTLRKAALDSTPTYFISPKTRKPTQTYVAASTFVTGSIARTAVAILLAPLELFRTRMQSTGAHVSSNNILRSVLDLVKTEGSFSLWRGLSATLWRDVPFSGFYWAGYEGFRRSLTGGRGMGEMAQNEKASKTFSIAFTSGAASGTIASFLTHPFDVIKTRRQTEPSSVAARTTLTFLKDIAKREGMAGLWSGIVPRVAKIAPACGVMIGMYESGLRWTGETE